MFVRIEFAIWVCLVFVYDVLKTSKYPQNMVQLLFSSKECHKNKTVCWRWLLAQSIKIFLFSIYHANDGFSLKNIQIRNKMNIAFPLPNFVYKCFFFGWKFRVNSGQESFRSWSKVYCTLNGRKRWNILH